MADFCFKHAQIKGMSVTLGEERHSFNDEPLYWNNNELLCKRLKKTIGFGNRYWSKPETTAADLCYDAAIRLFNAMNIKPESFDAIISVTQTPDYLMPGNAHVLHELLALPKSCAALDIELGCTGFLFALQNAYMMIECGAKRVLIVAGDTLSKTINSKDRTEAPLFSDVGSACIVDRENDETCSYFSLCSDGKGVQKMLQPAGGYRVPSTEETRKEKSDKEGNIRSDENFYMNGLEVFNFTLSEQPPLLRNILEQSRKTKEEIDYYILHQGNSYIVENLAKNLKLPSEKVPVIFPEYGNQSCASIPGTVCAALSDKLSDKKQMIFQAFGIGLSWGACQLELNNPTVLRPVVYGEYGCRI